MNLRPPWPRPPHDFQAGTGKRGGITEQRPAIFTRGTARRYHGWHEHFPNLTFIDASFQILYFATLLVVATVSWWMNTNDATIKIGKYTFSGDKQKNKTTNFIGAGSGFNPFVYFFTMCASLFSGYSVAGITNEAYSFGFQAIRWIPAGVSIYGCYQILAPRLHALGRSRGYLCIMEFIFDRYAVSGHPAVAHIIRIICLACLQLPVFTYLITQFSGLGVEVSIYTKGELTPIACIVISGATLCVFTILGGLRGVAYSDVVQGFALILGAFVFFCCQHVYLGGMGAVAEKTRSAAYRIANPFGYGMFNNVPKAEGSWSAASWSAFVLKVTIAATMFPHLIQRLFVAKSTTGMRVGFSIMNGTFFFIQFASMITGWVAAGYFADQKITSGVMASVANIIRNTGSTGQFASALIMSAAVSAFMSTADSCMMAFGTMWLKDFYLPYIQPGASQFHQVVFTKITAIIGLAVGVWLAIMSVTGDQPWSLSNLFSIQNATPIHVAPCVWMGLHWKGLRGEAVLFGLLVGLGTTLGMLFDTNYNVKLAAGLEENKQGWAPSLIGCAVNVCGTILIGVLLERFPNLIPLSSETPRFSRPIDIAKEFGDKPGREVSLLYWGGYVLIYIFIFPFYRAGDFGKQDAYVEFMPAWAFTSLFITALLTVYIAFGYWYFWQEYVCDKVPSKFPIHPSDVSRQDYGDDLIVVGKDIAPTAAETGVSSPRAPNMPPQQQALIPGMSMSMSHYVSPGFGQAAPMTPTFAYGVPGGGTVGYPMMPTGSSTAFPGRY